jgi:glycerol-3-phosphate dehydrogenase (NAD(P)+)
LIAGDKPLWRLPDRPTVTVLGAGQMGLVCAAILASPDTGRPAGVGMPIVKVWGHDTDEIASVAQTRRSHRLPGFTLPDEVRVVFDIKKALENTDIIVSAVPVQPMRQAWQAIAQHVPARAGVLSVAKGIENDTLARPSTIIAETLGDNPDRAPRPIGCLSGPTVATELARCLPATMIAASEFPGFAPEVQRLFNTSWLRIYTQADLLGVELAGALKNVIAIAAGILDGLQAGSNAKSALLARGLAEISRLGVAMGASPDTFFGIAGVGDLATTCFSPEGRNRSCGEALGKGRQLAEYLEESPFVVEGVATARSVVDLAKKYRIEMPITEAVHAVLFEGLEPLIAIGQLMSRRLKGERIA